MADEPKKFAATDEDIEQMVRLVRTAEILAASLKMSVSDAMRSLLLTFRVVTQMQTEDGKSILDLMNSAAKTRH